MTPGGGGPEDRRTQAQVATAIAGGFVLLVLLAVGLTRMIDGRAASEVAAQPTPRAASARTSPARIPPRQPAMTGSSIGTGESIRPAPAPAPARIIDTGTGKEVLVPGGTTRAGGTATTGPRTGTTGTTSDGTSTTGDPTTSTSPPTSEDTTESTTTTTTEATTTTTTTEATTTTTTTEVTTTTTPPPP